MVSSVQALRKYGYYSRLGLLYIVSLAGLGYLIHPVPVLSDVQRVSFAHPDPSLTAKTPRVVRVAGQPVRVVIPASGVDLPVDPGQYNPADGSWTLSGLRAQFATSSSPANNIAGDTFIYGHNNNSVFGALRHNTPVRGATALIYTDNGHVLSYAFVFAKNLRPDDTSVLRYSGPPVMTIQTCTGSFNEWRTLYRFHFEKVIS